MHLTRRKFIRRVAVATSALALVGCAPIGAPAPTAAPPGPVQGKPVEAKPAATQAVPIAAKPTEAAAAKAASGQAPAAAAGPPVRGGRLIVGKTADITKFDPYALNPGSFPMFNAIWNVLARYDQALKPQPELAESWELAPDNLSLTLKLRKGVKFHSGRELDAEDVAFSFDWARDEKRAANIRPLAMEVKQVETPDPSTVVLRFDKPNPGVFDTLDLLYILDRETAGKDESKGIGTGPFIVDQWLPGNELRLSRFPDYWRQDLPYLDGVVLRVIPDAASLSVSLESGGVHLAERVQVSEFKRLAANPALQSGTAAVGASFFNVLLSVRQSPLDDARVRQAVALTINRQRFATTVMEGIVEAACLPYPPSSFGYDREQAEHCKHDPEGARQLLAEAGAGGGFDVALTTSTQVAPELPKLAQIVQADLGAVGIRVRIEDVEQSIWTERSVKGDYQMMTHTYGRAHKDPTSLFGTAVVWRPTNNPTGYSSPEYARLVAEAGTTLDPQRRKELYRQVNDLVLQDNWVVPVAPNPRPWVSRGEVQGVDFNLDGMLLLDKIWIKP